MKYVIAFLTVALVGCASTSTTNGKQDLVLDKEVKLCPPEEIIWSKSFIMERERFDGADINHLLRICAATHAQIAADFARRVRYGRRPPVSLRIPGESRACQSEIHRPGRRP